MPVKRFSGESTKADIHFQKQKMVSGEYNGSGPDSSPVCILDSKSMEQTRVYGKAIREKRDESNGKKKNPD